MSLVSRIELLFRMRSRGRSHCQNRNFWMVSLQQPVIIENMRSQFSIVRSRRNEKASPQRSAEGSTTILFDKC